MSSEPGQVPPLRIMTGSEDCGREPRFGGDQALVEAVAAIVRGESDDTQPKHR